MTKILYINGFGGGGRSPKLDALEAAFPGQVVAPYISARADDAFRQICWEAGRIYEKNNSIIFVGTSLGGFWSAFFSTYFGEKAVMLNPSLDPGKSLTKYVGREIDGKEWMFCDALAYNEYKLKLNDGIPRIVLCEMGDDIISSDDVIEQLGMNQEHHAEFHLLPGGSHRFENYPAMIDAIKRLMNQEPH